MNRPVRGLDGYDPLAPVEESKTDANGLYETEKVVSTLTISDLDEIKAFVVDDVILEVASGKITDMTPQEVANMMQDKLDNLFEQ